MPILPAPRVGLDAHDDRRAPEHVVDALPRREACALLAAEPSLAVAPQPRVPPPRTWGLEEDGIGVRVDAAPEEEEEIPQEIGFLSSASAPSERSSEAGERGIKGAPVATHHDAKWQMPPQIPHDILLIPVLLATQDIVDERLSIVITQQPGTPPLRSGAVNPALDVLASCASPVRLPHGPVAVPRLSLSLLGEIPGHPGFEVRSDARRPRLGELEQVRGVRGAVVICRVC